MVTVLLYAPTAQADSALPIPTNTLAPDAPPPGLVPSSSTVAAVLAAWRAAQGKASVRISTEVEVDSVTAFGLTGTDRTVYAGDNFRETFSLGPTSTQYGRFDGQEWTADENGAVIRETGVHKRDDIDAQALRRATSATDADITLAGEVDQPVAAFVLKVNPPNGRLEWLYIDKKTSLLDRADDAYPDKRLAITFSDYRPLDGVMEARHVHFSDGWAANEADMVVKSDDVNVPVSSDQIAIPTNTALVSFPPGAMSVTLPARIDDGSVVVRIMVNGRGLDFLLDSGSSGILLDSDVAQQLGIKTFGQSVQTTMGSYQQTEAIIPQMDIGPISLHNTYVDCVPFTQQLGFDTKIVGLLGFDFIDNAVVSIDYDSGTVTATPPDEYVLPTNAITQNIAQDDGVPRAAVQVGGAIGDHFIVDTGSTNNVIFSGFADAHPQDVADKGLGKSIMSYLPYVTTSGVGGQLHMKITQLVSFYFGSINFTNFLAMETPSGSAFESEDTDGLVGYDVLQYFTVTLDYRDGVIVLNPGSVLRARQTGTP